MKSGIRLHQRATYVVCLLGMSLALMPLRTLAQAALPASFLSAGLTKALNRLGAKLDSQSSSSLGSGNLGFQGSFDPSGPSPVWSVTLSGDLDGNSPGRVIFSSDDQTSTLAPVTVVDANPAHEAHSLKFEVSVPRQVAFRSEDQAVKVFALELTAPEAGTALQPGTYTGATAGVANGLAQLDVFLGVDSCHSPSRQFTIDELTYSEGQVATLVARFSCGQRFHGVLRYEDVTLSGALVARYNGLIWEDEDADGIRAGNGLNRPDGPLSNVPVHLLRDGVRVSTTHSDHEGRYRFQAPVGTYRVEIEQPMGLAITSRDVGGDEYRDSDIDPLSGRSDPQLLTDGGNPVLTIGLVRRGSRATLPVASTLLQPLRAGDRMSYVESDSGVAYATDTVLPGAHMRNGSITRRLRDSADNLLFLSNDERGLRLHRAVMKLPVSGRQYGFDFNPPLVLLSGSVELGSTTSRGSVQVRRVDVSASKSPLFKLRYVAESEVTLNNYAGVAAEELPEFPGPHGPVSVVNIERLLRFSGELKGTPLATETRSVEHYGVDLGLLGSGMVGAPHVNQLTALRRGAQEDMDGDRRADVLALDSSSIRLYPQVVVPGVPFTVDDTADLLAWHPRANGGEPQTLGRVSSTAALRGDFDGDGQVELLNYDSNSGLVSLVDGFDSNSVPRPLSFAPPNAQLFASGDFKRAGRRELLWRDAATGALTMWTIDGSVLPIRNTLVNAAGGSLRTPPAWQLAGVGDFDADGASDLLWREASGERSALWRMSGETRIASVLLPRMKSRLRVAAVNDFDGDGNSDLLWYDSAKRSLRLWLIDHARLRSDLDLGLAPQGAKVFASGDYDGNGNADLLWRDGNQALTLWLLRNARRSKVIDVGHFIRDQKLVP